MQVFNISLLSGLPAETLDICPLEPLPVRLRPLFNVGVRDISDLCKDSGWVASSTDSILGLRDGLYDYVVRLSAEQPTVISADGTVVLATQRDLRRFRRLAHLLDLPQDTYLVEPQSWTSMAWNGLLWWASSGQRGAEMDEEDDFDLLLQRQAQDHGSEPEKVILAYFHRLTCVLMETISDFTDDFSDDEDALQTRGVSLEAADLQRVGLDLQSQTDRSFLRQFVELYWGQDAQIHANRIECCGIRIW